MKFLIILSLLSAGVRTESIAQTAFVYPVKKNETVPDLSFTISIDGKDYRKSFDDYKGKILLLDFWGVNCTDCIASMPKMLQLQKKFKNDIQIILVTENSAEQIQKLWNKFDHAAYAQEWIKAGKELSFIKNDSVIRKLFPYDGLPTHVWIDKNNKLVSTAYYTSTTEGNIRRLLAGQPVELDEISGLDINNDGLINNPISWFKLGNNNMPYYSFIFPRIEFGGGGSGWALLLIDSISGKPNAISCINRTIVELYKAAYKDKLPFNPTIPENRIMLETKERYKYYAPAYDSSYYAWANKNVFCYALKMPVHSSVQLYSYMKKDLDRFFGLSSSVEKQKVKCWVLKRITQINKIVANGEIEKYEKSNSHIILENSNMARLFDILKDVFELQFPRMPFFNKTNYSGKINIKLPWQADLKNMSILKLKNVLRGYGLDIIEQNTEIDMLVIKEN